MQQSRQPFFVIGHNPNSIEEANDYLLKGANALEPDIVYADGIFYVSHQEHLSYDGVPTLNDYLLGLTHLLQDNPRYQLALIIWDIKTTNFDPNELVAQIKKSFTGKAAEEVVMLLTHADDHAFLSRYDGNDARIGIGTDESNESAAALQGYFKTAGHRRISYADGITTLLSKTGIVENIVAAKLQQASGDETTFRFVYTWVLSQEKSLRRFLNLYINAIMVDMNGVDTLLRLLKEPPYEAVYELAAPGQNPFADEIQDQYLLEVTTADQPFAGTDADLVFVVQGSRASITSLPVETGMLSRMERGTMSSHVIEGPDIGDIKGISIQLLSGGIASAWLPESIHVTNKKKNVSALFTYSQGPSPDWVRHETGVITKQL